MLEILGVKCCEGVEVLGAGSARVVRAVGKAMLTVMSSVFDGREGVTNGGRPERSRESGVSVLWDRAVDVGLRDGEAEGELS